MHIRKLSSQMAKMAGFIAITIAGFWCANALKTEARESDTTTATDVTNGKSIELARGLIQELENQAESQRVELKKTEANLIKAKDLLKALDGAKTRDLQQIHELKSLKAAEEMHSEQYEKLRRLIRNSNDPSFLATKKQLAEVRAKIKEIEDK